MRRSLSAVVAVLFSPLAALAADEVPAPKPVGPAPAPVEAAPAVGPYAVLPGVGLNGAPFPIPCPPFVMDAPNDLLPPGSPYLSHADGKGRMFSPYHVLYTIPAESQRAILRAKLDRYPLVKPAGEKLPPPAGDPKGGEPKPADPKPDDPK
jgi:hypothetical protein